MDDDVKTSAGGKGKRRRVVDDGKPKKEQTFFKKYVHFCNIVK